MCLFVALVLFTSKNGKLPKKSHHLIKKSLVSFLFANNKIQIISKYYHLFVKPENMIFINVLCTFQKRHMHYTQIDR